MNDTVPSWLWQPPASSVRLPVDTRKHVLPLEELAWADFERLCTKLASRTARVEHAQQYGVPGQAQEAIDIYARKVGTDRYTTWQCKRYQTFSASKLREAAEDFLVGAWAGKSDVFHLCVTVPIEDQSLANEIEALAPRFTERSISFLPLGKIQLSEKLKCHPDVVDEFFGRPWVVSFCGEEAATGLTRRRLTPVRVSELRQLLGQLYSAHFNALDPGIPSAAHMEVLSIPLSERFVEPDILEQRTINPRPTSEQPLQPLALEPMSPHSARQPRHAERTGRETQDIRSSLTSWLSQNRLSAIIGEAGRGKTTLLRAIALDLLSTEPRLASLARLWGNSIPVWVPFALWVRNVANSSQVGLSEVISIWLRSVSAQPELETLIREALEDDRLLLLIDGVDEWTNEAAAGVAVTLLQTFVGARNVAAIATSRPLGYQRLGGLGTQWNVGRLAPLTHRQQRAVARHWFTQREISTKTDGSVDAARERGEGNAERFIGEIGRSAPLSQLAATPLLLTGIIALQLAGERLPTSRFRAYERLSALLTREHPDRRARSTLTPRANTWNEDTRDRVLDAIAFATTTSEAATAIDYDSAREIAVKYLRDDLGQRNTDAIQQAPGLIEELRDGYGVLVERSARELGFLHKCFQDFHAARYLARQPLERQREFVRTWIAVPSTHDVILSLCFLTPRSSDVDSLLGEMETLCSGVTSYGVENTAAQVALCDLNCSVARARSSAERAISLIALDEWQPARARLVNTLLDGLNSDRLRSRVLQAASDWFPQRSRHLRNIYSAMSVWPARADVRDALTLGIGRAEIGDRHTAARSLATTAAGDDDVEAKLSEALFCGEGGTAAAALHALARGWGDKLLTRARLDEARRSKYDEVRLIGAICRVSLGVQDDSDLEVLIEIASDGGGFQPRYEFRRTIADAVMSGWPVDARVRAACLASIAEQWGNRRALHVDIAAPILFLGYPVSEDIAELVADVFHESEFLDHRLGDDWAALLSKYRRHPTVSAAVDTWLHTYQSESRLGDGMDAAALSGSQAAKDYVLANRDHRWGSPFWIARSLLVGWDRGDAAIEAVLADMVASPDRAQHVANLVPEIVANQAQSESILFGVLEQAQPYRIDGAVEALHALGHDHHSTRFADAVFGQKLEPDKLGYGSTFDDIINALHGHERARELALVELQSHEPQVGVIARWYGDDEEIRTLLLRMTRSLPHSLRLATVERLSAVAVDNPEAEALLGDYDCDIDGDVKVAGSVGFWSSLQARAGVGDAELARLSQDIRAVGFDYELRRHAAFAAFMTIGRLDVPSVATLQVGDRLTNIRDRLASRAGTSLLRLIAQQWKAICEMYGDEVWANVGGDHTSSIEALAPFADENDELREALVRRIEIAPLSELGEASILLLARERRGSEFLKVKLFEVLEEQDYGWYAVQNKLVAVDVLGRDFHDPEMAEMFKRLAISGNDEALIGLCDWWPEHEYVRSLAWDVTSTGRRYRLYVELSVRIATLDTVQLIDFLSKRFARFRGEIWEFHPRSTEPLVRRLSRDETLREAVATRLSVTGVSPGETASWPGLLQRAGNVTPSLLEWCKEEIARQRGMILPEFGIDTNFGAIRSVRRALLDVVAPLA